MHDTIFEHLQLHTPFKLVYIPQVRYIYNWVHVYQTHHLRVTFTYHYCQIQDSRGFSSHSCSWPGLVLQFGLLIHAFRGSFKPLSSISAGIDTVGKFRRCPMCEPIWYISRGFRSNARFVNQMAPTPTKSCRACARPPILESTAERGWGVRLTYCALSEPVTPPFSALLRESMGGHIESNDSSIRRLR